jgi:flagellar hook assembly protein FlgD
MIALNARQSQKVEIDIYNIKGQLVRRLERFYAKSGENLQNWDGRDNLGDSVAPGLYLIKAKSGSQRITQKCLKF